MGFVCLLNSPTSHTHTHTHTHPTPSRRQIFGYSDLKDSFSKLPQLKCADPKKVVQVKGGKGGGKGGGRGKAARDSKTAKASVVQAKAKYDKETKKLEDAEALAEEYKAAAALATRWHEQAVQDREAREDLAKANAVALVLKESATQDTPTDVPVAASPNDGAVDALVVALVEVTGGKRPQQEVDGKQVCHRF